jgi:hypothetical protein
LHEIQPSVTKPDTFIHLQSRAREANSPVDHQLAIPDMKQEQAYSKKKVMQQKTR